jgi:hypothetical protein
MGASTLSNPGTQIVEEGRVTILGSDRGSSFGLWAFGNFYRIKELCLKL